MSCCLIFLLLGAIALYSCECASIQSSVTYVLGENGESQLSACSRVGMYPTAISALIDWSYGVFLNVSTDFGMEPLDPSGISGCCVGGMWCNGTVCFTQSFSSSFQNYGALSFLPGGTSTFQPVYSCDGGSFCENGLDMTGGACNTTVPASSVSLSSATLENTYPEPSSGMVGEIVGVTMLLQGTNFGTDQSAVGVSLAGSSGDSSGSAPITPYCSYLELCTDLCGTCNTGVDCPNGAACISPSQGAQGHCFPYCAGPTDDSCPCGSSCLSVVVGSTMDSGQNVGVQVNLCTPDSSFACNTGIYGRGTEAAMCTIAGGNYVAASGQNVSIIVGGEGDSEGGSVTMLTNSVSSTNGFEVLSVDTELESSADPESELMQVHAHGKLRGAVMDGSRNDMIVDVHVQQTSVARRLNAQCSTDSDCNDGDRCTINACVDSVCTVLLNNSINGAADCVSSLPALQQKSAPFTYINAQFSNASPRQAAFMSFMLQNGQVATDRGGSSIYLTVADSNSDSTIPLSSLTEFQYFGNKVTEIGVAPMGVVTLTPVPYCDSRVREILVSKGLWLLTDYVIDCVIV